MFSRVLLLYIFCLVNTCLGEECETDCPKPTPCSPDDEPCMAAIVNHYAAPAISKIVKDSLWEADCMEIDSLSGKFSIIKYHVVNNTITGFKSCNLTKINISPDVSAAQFVFECPAYVVSGYIHELCGYLLYIPIIGKGKYEYHFGKHCITVYAKIIRVKGCEGKTHLQLGDFTTDVKALGPTKYNSTCLYHGNEYLSKGKATFAHNDCNTTQAGAQMVSKIASAKLRHKGEKTHVIAIRPAPVPFHWNTEMKHYCLAAEIAKIVNDFANCHWKELAVFIDGPLWNSIILKLFTACNKKLLKSSSEKLFMC